MVTCSATRRLVFEVTDERLNPVPNYHINAKAFDGAIRRLNRFYKK